MHDARCTIAMFARVARGGETKQKQSGIFEDDGALVEGKSPV